MPAGTSNETVARGEVERQLGALLKGGEAHTSFATAVADFPPELRGSIPDKLPYSAWQLIEHIRIAQHDILEFCAPPASGYQHLKWPDDYWPKAPEPPTPSAWEETLAAIERDRQSFTALLGQQTADLVQPFAWGDGQNLLREALLIADHLSYHTGELVVLRRLLGIWNPR